MANFKKQDKASMIARIEDLEKAFGLLEKLLVSAVVPGLSSGPEAGNSIITSPPPFTGVLSEATVVQAPTPTAEVKHKCQTSNCLSVETKEYQGSGMKMWLCETHKV